MQETVIRIFLTEKNFKKSYLHYDIELNEYYLFVNTKKNNRKIKELCRKAKRIIAREKNIDTNSKLLFLPIKCNQFLERKEG